MKINLNLDYEDTNPTQDDQSIELKFAFCDYTQKDNEYDFFLIHQPILCRDFLNDMLMVKNTDSIIELYGFKADGKKFQYDKSNHYLYLHFPELVTKHTFIQSFNYYINDYDEMSNNKPTEIFYDNECNMIIKCDSEWCLTTQSLSLFTFLLRVMCYPVILESDLITDFLNYCNEETIDEYYNTDYNLLTNRDYKPEYFTNYLKVYKQLYLKYPSVNYLTVENPHHLHDGSGIFSFFDDVYIRPKTIYITEEVKQTYLKLIKNEM